jgi:ectoine hydroxylase-related dioxygenase (phytanoyl-CoA dioxygenase family)
MIHGGERTSQEQHKPDLGILDSAIGDDFVECPLDPGDALIIHPHVVHSVGPNLSSITKVSMLVCYKCSDAIDMQPGGNKRSLAELPVSRGKHALAVFGLGVHRAECLP